MKKLIIISPIFLLLSFQSGKYDIEHGKKLFMANCAACHNPTTPVVGPPFQLIRQDYDTNRIFTFIRNHDSFAKSDDIKANYLHKIWQRTSFSTTFHNLNNNDLFAILNYVDTFSSYKAKYYNHRKLSILQIQSILTTLDTMKFEDPFKRMEYIDSLAGK